MKYLINYVSLSFIFIIMAASCSKNDNDNSDSIDVSGIYKGTLTTQSSGLVTNATVEARQIDGKSVEIHCYGEELDTTFMMQTFENGDSIMLCYTDSMFHQTYGHHLTAEHHGTGGMMNDEMMNSNGMIYWNHHIDEEHNENDMHYGGFDIMNHTCDYTLLINAGDTVIHKRFQGKKQ